MTMTAKADPARSSEAVASNPALDLAAILTRRKRLVLGVFLVVTAVVATGAMRAPLAFRAESSLLVRMGREYVYRSELGRSELARTPSLSEIVNSEVEILASRDLAELVVVQLGIERLYPGLAELEPDPSVARDRAVLRFRQASSVRPVLESSVIKVAYEHEDPALAAEAVNLLVERFRDKHVEVFGEEQASGLEDQLAARRADLTHAEEALTVFKRKSGVFDLDEQRSLLLGQRVRMDDALRDCGLRIVETTPLLAAGLTRQPAMALVADGATAGTPGEGAWAPGTDAFEEHGLEPAAAERLIETASVRLLELQLEERELLRDHGPENRKVQGLRTQLALVAECLSRTRAQATAFDEARRDALERQLADLDRRIAELDRQGQTLRQLERELTASETALQIIRERVEEARISEELDRARRINVRVIEKAAAPVEPTGLSRSLKTVMGAFIGLLAGAALAVFLEIVRR